MNVEQVKSAVRWVIATFGPFFIAHGYATDSTITLASGVLISLVPLVWSMFQHTEASAVGVVDTIAKQPNSPVKAVVVEPTKEGKELAESLPGSTTVVSGTAEAKEAVKP